MTRRDQTRVVNQTVLSHCPYVYGKPSYLGSRCPGRATSLDSRLRENDTMRSDQNREGSRVTRLPMCLAHRHTRGGGYPEDGINLESGVKDMTRYLRISDRTRFNFSK